ncbi:MAG: RNA recognition motif domain-containing protein [Alphaproteobacteria bacterium]
MRLFVGNLPYNVGNDELQQAFEEVGQVVSARVITDRESGQSRGFGFVEMASAADGQKAIQEWNGRELAGRALTVNEAKPQPEGSRGGGGGGWRGGGGRDRR